MVSSILLADSTPCRSSLGCTPPRNLQNTPKLMGHDKRYVNLRNFHQSLPQNKLLYLPALQKLLGHDHKYLYMLDFVNENAQQVSYSSLVQTKKSQQQHFLMYRTYHRIRQRYGSSDSNNPTAQPAKWPR